MSARDSSSSWDVISMIEQELAKLKPELGRRSEARQRLSEELVEAKKAEAEAKTALAQSLITEQEKRSIVRARFRAGVRKVIMKNRIIAAMNNELAAQIAAGPLLPQKLRGQLHQLQHSLHGLKYHEDDRERGATRLQAWWRGVIGRRLVCCVRICQEMHKVHQRLQVATVQIQCWYRSRSTRKKWRAKIANRLETRRQTEEAFQEQKLRVTIQMQRAIRARLARKRVAEERERMARRMRHVTEQEQPDPNIGKPAKLVDSWRNPHEDHADKAEDRAPPPDLELAKIRDVGLVPFYWNYATDTIRHRIGGHEAIKIQQQLKVGLGAEPEKDRAEDGSSSAASSDNEDDSRSAVSTFATEPIPEDGIKESQVTGGEEQEPPPTDRTETRKKTKFKFFTAQDDVESSEAALGANWNVYPEGLPAGFVEHLDEDVSSSKQKKKPAQKKPEKKRPSRRQSSLRVPPPPHHAERRQSVREAEEQKKEEDQFKKRVSQAVEHLQHPMLGGLIECMMPNVPEHTSPLKAVAKLRALEALKPKPPALPPSGRPRPSLALNRGQAATQNDAQEEDDDPWAGVTNFYGKERNLINTTDFTSPMPASGKRLGAGYREDEGHAVQW